MCVCMWLCGLKQRRHGAAMGIDSWLNEPSGQALGLRAEDKDTWCPTPAGARRGLNLTFGYPMQEMVTSSSQHAEDCFLQLAKVCLSEVRKNAPTFAEERKLPAPRPAVPRAQCGPYLLRGPDV